MKTRLWRFKIYPRWGVTIYRSKYTGGRYYSFEIQYVDTAIATKFLGKLLYLGAELSNISFEDLEIELQWHERIYML